MSYHLELGSDGRAYNGRAIVVDTKGRHYSNQPIPLKNAKAQMKALIASEHKEKTKMK
jgi:hypothetical protein